MRSMPTRRLAVAVSGIALAAAAGSLAHAGAFQLNERSSRALGTSLANSVSSTSDLTFMGFNPAALTRVEHLEAAGSLSLVSPISDGTVQTGPFAGQTVDADRQAVLAAGYLGYNFGDGVYFGFAQHTPFGLVTQYPTSWAGAADGITSRLTTIQFSPTVAYKVSDQLSIGGAFNVLYADARLTSAALLLDGSDVAFSFSMGAHYKPIASTTIGVAYHHGYDLELIGTAENAFIPLVEFGTQANARLPGTVQVGVTHELTEDLRVSLEGRWINWARFDAIEIQTPTVPIPGLQSITDEQNYDNALFFALGGEYDVTEDISVRGGVAWDQTPTNDEFRTVRVPDEDRLWFSIGGSYQMSEHMAIDASFSYLTAIDDPSVTLRNGPLAGTLVSYDGGAFIASLGGSLKF